MKPHIVQARDAAKINDWLLTRGGIAIWASINLSNLGASWTAPVLDGDGKPAGKPNWQTANTPERMIFDPAEVAVVVPKEIKLFHVAVQTGFLGIQVTDGGTRRIRAAVAKAGDNAWYEFDYSTQEAVILVPDETVSLSAWMARSAFVPVA